MPPPSVFVVQPFGPPFDGVYARLLQPAAAAAGARVFRADEVATTGMILESIFGAIEACDLVIADLTGKNPHVMYELGFAHALRKPVLMMIDGHEQTPFDIAAVRIIRYSSGGVGSALAKNELEAAIRAALANPSAYSSRPHTDEALNTVFLSYSHSDAEFLERVMVHLRPLERRGLIDPWVDTRLEAGDKWKEPAPLV